MLRLLTFNILSPNFSDPQYYPISCHPYLDQHLRREATTRFIQSMMDICDIFAFQEVTADTIFYDNPQPYIKLGEFNYLNQLLGDKYYGMFFPHDVNYWKEHIGDDFEYSYIQNGNALFYRKDIFTVPIWHKISSLTGNTSIRGDVIHIASQKLIRCINVHLDSDYSDNRIIELSGTISTFNLTNHCFDIIMGDFNTLMTNPQIKEILVKNNFTDALGTNTNPSYPIINDITDCGAIDNIIYRGACIPILSQSKVIDNDLWNMYPKFCASDDIRGPERLKLCLQLYGSDHFPVIATFKL